MGQEARVVIGPQPVVERLDPFRRARADDDAAPFRADTLDQVGQRLVDPAPLEVVEAELAQARRRAYSPAGPTMTKVRSESVAISPSDTPPGTCSSVLPAT